MQFKVFIRGISTTRTLLGKRNFRKFIIPNRGPQIFKERQKTNPDPAIPVYTYGVREVGYKDGDKYVTVPETMPEIVVPDLTGFELKPYVSYRATDITQTEFTAKDLFSVVYAKKIVDDFEAGKLDEKGNPLEPSEEEKLTAIEAKLKARQTGSDIFSPKSKREEEESYLKNY